MRAKLLLPLFLLVSLIPTALRAQTPLDVLTRNAVSKDPKQAAAAIVQLRALGPAGLQAMFATHAVAINKQIADPLLPNTAEWQRLSDALDAVSQQKNSYLSGMYWFTDLGEAKAAAKKSGKPILSLRLLGNLSEEFSCANSRFFRTILYANASISKELRENFVLHWKSVRPVPRVTIDFGDGRKLERTLTGNSIHYILDVEGRPIEALPGLYGPNAFLRALVASEKIFAKLQDAKNPNPGGALLSYRRDRINRLNVNWVTDIEKIGGKAPEGLVVMRNPNGTVGAVSTWQLAMTKAASEASLLRSLTAGPDALMSVTDENAWRRIARLHFDDAQLDGRSIGLIQRETRKVVGKNDLASLLEKLQLNIAFDTVRNEYFMHSKLYAWLIEDKGRSGVETFNEKVYNELFLTPASDPWLGLFNADTYMALEDGGVVR